MKTDKSKLAARQNQDVSALNSRKLRAKATSSNTVTTEFGRNLKSLLGRTAVSGQVSEEELFAATTHQLIQNRFGESLARDFRSAFKLNMADKPPTERFASAERAAKESLRFFVESTLITREEAQQLRTLASNLSQLDDNDTKLWDSWGDTRAVTSFSRGQTLVQGRLEQSGNAPVRSSSSPKQVSASSYGGERAATGATQTKGSKSPKPSTAAVKRTA